MLRLLTFIGTGNYLETTYTLGEAASPTDLVSAALLAWNPEAFCTVFATVQALDAKQSLLGERLPNANIVVVPTGSTKDELWSVFSTIVDSVDVGDSIIVDVTHGFRSQPMLLLMAVMFLRTAKHCTVEGVYYGAYDSARPETTPVFDLTPFIDMVDWSHAVEAYFASGSTAGLKSLTRTTKPKPGEDVDLSRRSSIVTELHSLSQNLMTSRTGKVGEAAQRATAAISAAKKGKQEPKPIAYLLDRLEEKVSQLALAASNQTNETLLENHYQQVCWLIDHGHYNAAISLGRELYVTYFLLKAYPAADYKDKGKRRQAELWLGYYSGPMSEEPAGDFLPLVASESSLHLKFYGILSDRRNDIQHAGMRPQELDYDKIVGVCGELRTEFAELLRLSPSSPKKN